MRDAVCIGNTKYMYVRCCFRFRFKDVYYDADQMYYSYNPCGGFTEGGCSEAAVSSMNLVCLFV